MSLKILSTLTALAAVAAFGMSAHVFAQSKPAQPYKVPRTVDGQPDLQGVWTNATLTPVERPANLGTQATMTEQAAQAREKQMEQMVVEADKPSDPNQQLGRGNPGGYNTFWFNPANKVALVNGARRTSLITKPANGRVPELTQRGQEAVAARRARAAQGPYDGPEQGNLGERCIVGFGGSAGPPMFPVMYNANYQIVQSKDAVMIQVEMVHDARVIRLNSKHRPDYVRTWMGDSVGRFEGDTLVVETTNYHPGHTIQIGGGASYRSIFPSPKLKVTERFTRTSPQSILYEFAVEDPDTFKEAWGGQMPLTASREPIYEYACHEGNYALPGILAGAREDEKKGKKTVEGTGVE
jgi:TolA-binding protein